MFISGIPHILSSWFRSRVSHYFYDVPGKGFFSFFIIFQWNAEDISLCLEVYFPHCHRKWSLLCSVWLKIFFKSTLLIFSCMIISLLDLDSLFTSNNYIIFYCFPLDFIVVVGVFVFFISDSNTSGMYLGGLGLGTVWK